MYLSGPQVRRERSGRHEPSTKEGPSMSRKTKKKLTIVRKRDFWMRGRRYHWMRWRRGCTHMEREEDLRYCCLSPPQIKLQGHLRGQPVPRGTTSSLEELHLRIRKWRTQTLHEVNNRAKLRSHRINKRVQSTRVASKKLSWLRVMRGWTTSSVQYKARRLTLYAGVQQSVEWH
jgi:hypothetical protein